MTKNFPALNVVLAVFLVVWVSTALGCANIIDAAMDRAGTKIGARIGDEVGDQVGKAAASAVRASLMDLTPVLMQLYVQALFSAGFHHGGYHYSALSYEPGQWTRWKATGVDQGDELEKAFLKREDGKEWWRISAKGKRDGKMEEVIIEALFEAAEADEGLRTLVRLRRKFPGDEEAVEVPVTDDNRAQWYRAPIRLTEESVKGATVGTEDVTVPAGSYTCRHLKYAHGGGGDTMQWWLSDKVPGEIVKAVFTRKDAPKNGERPVRPCSRPRATTPPRVWALSELRLPATAFLALGPPLRQPGVRVASAPS